MPVRSSRLLELERAPRPRRNAQRLEDQAERSTDPGKARALARRMRVRAAQLESGNQGPDVLTEALAMMQEFGSHADE